MHKLWTVWTHVLVALGLSVGPTDPAVISYGPLPQQVTVYNHNVNTAPYWERPLTLDPSDLSYVQHFHNPSNYGLMGLPLIDKPWESRRLHLNANCNQAAALTDRQKLAFSLILKHADSLPNGAVTWRYDYALNYLHLVFEPGFNSAFSQAVNISALLFASCKTRDPIYLDIARKATLGLITPIDQGGLRSSDNGMTFFEELPAPNGLSPHILNADILSVNVLFAMAEKTDDEQFKEFAEKGARTLLDVAPQYDAPKCIKYALKQIDACHPDYDAYDSVLFDDLAQWTGDDRFEKLSERWASRVPH